ncbi:MAG TPA: hypothetical protein VJB10_03605 [Candidatus Peribacteraceae bacterium]|nr:hypothetical protein [Candidatus Peribacteraceae bacterium]
MKQKQKRSSGFDRDQLRKMKYASVESKFHALEGMVEFAKEAQRALIKRGAKHRPWAG